MDTHNDFWTNPDPDVQIEVKTSSGADINSGTGVCTWNVSLEADKDCEAGTLLHNYSSVKAKL